MNNELLLDQDIGKQIQTIKTSVLTVEQHSLAEDVTPFGKSAAEFCVSKAPRLLVTKSSSLSGIPFNSNEIPYREGAPIQLLRYVKNWEGNNSQPGSIQIMEDALTIIKEIEEPVAVIAVVGSFRRGKSFLANLLLGRIDGFELGATVHGCTRGIYMWDTPFLLNGQRVIILDCEGINDPEQDQTWATMLFVLCLAISSVLVYNVNGVVEKKDVEKLFLMTDLTKRIHPPDDCNFYPHLAVLLRDFHFKQPDSFKQYFLSQLDKVNRQASNSVQQFFRDFDVYPIAHPGVLSDDLRLLDTLHPSRFSQEFRRTSTEAVTSILSKLAPRYIGPAYMNGIMFAQFLESSVKQLNDPTNNCMIAVPSEYEAVIRFIADKSIHRARRLYEVMMKRKLPPLPISWEKFADIHAEAFEEALGSLMAMLVGSARKINEFEIEFCKGVKKIESNYRKKNEKALCEFHENLAKRFWNSFVNVGLQEGNFFRTQADFDQAIEIFEYEYVMAMIKSPEATLVIKSYRNHYYPSAINRLSSNWSSRTAFTFNSSKPEAELEILDKIVEERRFYDELKSTEREVEIKNQKFEEKVQKMGEILKEQKLSEQELKRLIAEYEQVLASVKAENATKLSKMKDLWNSKKKYVKYALTGLRVVGAIAAFVAFVL
ncbi:9358_t:CDS:2 [Paraglomus brasilianum]|uniref:9358_t:CDS:1 n=1 Tax=Paraglomus brasilianum TaxID=144538 RepID=A0A9N9GD97_9GLOM|nr:9358_t:CDS:2 [Paraglomus brasilianum]